MCGIQKILGISHVLFAFCIPYTIARKDLGEIFESFSKDFKDEYKLKESECISLHALRLKIQKFLSIEYQAFSCCLPADG